MYASYWKLNRTPFENAVDTSFYFPSQTHQAALLKLQYVLENGHGAGLLCGEIGLGKSFLIQQLQEILPDNYGPVIKLVYPQLQPAEVLAYLAAELSPEAEQLDPRNSSLDRILRRLIESLRRYTADQKHVIIVIDDAQLIEHPGVFQALQLLLNFREQPEIDFTLFLVGGHALLAQVQRVGQLSERIAAKAVLQPLTPDETRQYVLHRLGIAGQHDPMFAPDAISAISELSGGNPRRINRLCDLSLLVGFADELTRISSSEVEAVAEEVYSVVPD